jgi:hypothetical protein
MPRLGMMVLLPELPGTMVVPKMLLLSITASALKRMTALMVASRLQLRMAILLLPMAHVATVAKVRYASLHVVSNY